MIKQGSWVQIQKIVLNPEDRAPNVPLDTKRVPLEMWVKGSLLKDAKMGERVEIKTLTGRVETGTLVAVNPTYQHDYGDFVPELLEIGEMVRKLVFGCEQDG